MTAPDRDPAPRAEGAAALLQGELSIAGRLDARFFALLEALDATGSLHKAARASGYSYKGAWLVLDTASNLCPVPLVETSTGGRGGGGSRLTPAGQALLAAWRTLHQRHQAFLHEQVAWMNDQPGLAALFRRLSMKTSARNQFAGTIRSVEAGPATTQATVAIAGGVEITAALTTASATRLRLAVGQEAIALVKASEVVLATDLAGWRLSSRNQLEGTVSRVAKGATTSLVGLALPGGAQVTASITNDAAEALSLEVGQPATALFKAYAVMLAVRD